MRSLGWHRKKLEERFKDIFLDAAEQIQATIAALRDGKLTAYGFPAAGASTCYPIILTLEDISLNPVVYREIDRTFTEAGLLVQEGVRPWQCIDVGEFEQIEVALNTGYSLMGLLDAKIGDSVGCYESRLPWHARMERPGIWESWQIAGTSTPFDIATVDVGVPNSVPDVLRQIVR